MSDEANEKVKDSEKVEDGASSDKEPSGGSTEPMTASGSDRLSSASTGGSKSWLPWAIAVVSVITLLLLVFQGLLPAQATTKSLNEDVARLEGELSAIKSTVAKEHEQVEALLKDREDLSQKKVLTEERLSRALEEKEEALAALEKAKKELSDALGTQIAAGDVLIKERKGELVVDVSDKLLFESGKVEVSEDGQKLLLEVAKSMKRLSPRQMFSVGGHTDSQRVVSEDIVERYPTNWELSTARASNVVRFLQEKGNVPGRQLIAAGFSQYQPASTNKTETGRQKNRRIEIVLLRRPKR